MATRMIVRRLTSALQSTGTCRSITQCRTLPLAVPHPQGCRGCAVCRTSLPPSHPKGCRGCAVCRTQPRAPLHPQGCCGCAICRTAGAAPTSAVHPQGCRGCAMCRNLRSGGLGAQIRSGSNTQAKDVRNTNNKESDIKNKNDNEANNQPKAAEHKLHETVRDSEVQFQRGLELSRKGKYDDAVEAFQQAIETDSGNSHAHHQLGCALMHSSKHADHSDGTAAGENASAEKAFRSAIRLDPLETTFHQSLGELMLKVGKVEDAQKEFRAVLNIEPGNARAKHGLEQIASRVRKQPERIHPSIMAVS